MKKWFKSGVAICLSAVMLAGCSFGSGSSESEQSSTLKVMYYDEASFHQEYGMLYSTLNPNVEIEVVSSNQIQTTYMEENDQDYNKALQAFIEKEQPDVIMLDPAQVSALVENGTLYDMDALVADKNYNAEGLIPGVIDNMKEIGSGKVYALPTSFNTQVLYYNKDLFDQYNIPYPTDQMTWTDIINLAKQFPTDGEPSERVYGLKMGWSKDFSELVSILANGEGLLQYNPDTLQMTMDTPAWNALVEQAKSLMDANVLFYDEMMYGDGGLIMRSDMYSGDPFIGGRLAMKLDFNYFIRQVEDAQEYAQDPDSVVQNWDIVTAPVSSQSPDTSGYMYYYNLLGINAASTNVDEAWKFISYITGDEHARVKSKLSYGNFPLRTKYMETDANYNYEAFYKLKPSNSNMVDYTKIPMRFQNEFYGTLYETFNKVSTGDMSIADALAELQIKGNELLASTDDPAQEGQEGDLEAPIQLFTDNALETTEIPVE